MPLAGHTLKAYDQQLNQLMELMLGMGERVRSLLRMCKQALQERSPDLVVKAKQEDQELNRLEAALEEASIAILALQQPMAVDLRFVTSALKISGILERAGDLAKNIVKRSTELGDYASDETIQGLQEMADLIEAMLKDALAAVQDRDAKRALEIWKRDDEVDGIYHKIIASMQQEMTRGRHIAACTHIVFMAKNFERIADYVTNMAKSVYFIVTGEPPTKSLIRGNKA